MAPSETEPRIPHAPQIFGASHGRHTRGKLLQTAWRVDFVPRSTTHELQEDGKGSRTAERTGRWIGSPVKKRGAMVRTWVGRRGRRWSRGEAKPRGRSSRRPRWRGPPPHCDPHSRRSALALARGKRPAARGRHGRGRSFGSIRTVVEYAAWR